MPCYHPWKPAPQLGLKPGLTLACGQCIGCRLERSRQWAIRCMHEAQMHERNSFITLTYDDEHAPLDYSLKHRHWQLFAKKLRKKKGPFRFYMCGEYGEQFSRPHYHACLFGIDFDDKEPILKLQTETNHTLYSSAELASLWKHGHASLGAVTFESAAYVARYVMKKITGDLAASHYTYIDENGEIFERRPEYNQMSRKPGIGKTWIDKYDTDVYPSDQVITRGYPTRPPRYYDQQQEKKNEHMMQQIKARRMAKLDQKDNTPKRLKAKETVATAKLNQLPRKLR